MENPAGDRREFDLPPADPDTARRRADRLAALVGAIVDPAHCRGARVVVVSIIDGAEIDARPVKARRRKRKPAPTDQTGQAREEAADDGRARYRFLRDSDANRAGWRVIDAARELLAELDRFETEGDPGKLWHAFARAGMKPESPTPGGYGSDYFDGAHADAAGFRWCLESFAHLLECGLVLRPETKGRASK